MQALENLDVVIYTIVVKAFVHLLNAPSVPILRQTPTLGHAAFEAKEANNHNQEPRKDVGHDGDHCRGTAGLVALFRYTERLEISNDAEAELGGECSIGTSGS